MDALETARDDVYRVGTIAAADLIEGHGILPFGQVFEDLGKGESWETAFENAFGQSPNAFYVAFSKRYH